MGVGERDSLRYGRVQKTSFKVLCLLGSITLGVQGHTPVKMDNVSAKRRDQQPSLWGDNQAGPSHYADEDVLHSAMPDSP